jgi:hypothetical protein
MLSYAVALVAITALVMLYRRDRRRLQAQRAQLFDSCLDLFQSYRITQEGPNYPLLSGRYRGYEARLEPVIDNLAWRKVPVLWLRATILKPNDYTGVLDLLVRPGGVEVYSPSSELDYHLALPEGWPEQALLCTDDPTSIPPLELLTPHMRHFADPYMKELVLSSRGVRLVRMIWQASRLHYAIFREIRFEGIHLDPAVVKDLLDGAIDIADALSDPDSVTGISPPRSIPKVA